MPDESVPTGAQQMWSIDFRNRSLRDVAACSTPKQTSLISRPRGCGLILSSLSFLMLVSDCVGRPRPRVQIAKAAITSNYIRNTLFHRAVLAIPVSISSKAIDSAPGGVAISSAGRSSEPRCRYGGSTLRLLF